MRPNCIICGKGAMSHGLQRGKQRYKKYCTQCLRYSYKRRKRGFCQRCGFLPEWLGQLDVDHIDGDSNNNNPSNLQTLCANCHRLKTHQEKDYNPKRLVNG